MKKLFLSLSILAQVVFSMEREEIELDTKCADEECHQPVEQAISPSHTLPNFQAYSFIDCLKPGEVLFSVTTEEGLNVSNEFKDFFVVCHQAERYGDAYYFVPQNMKDDAEKALALYSKTSPSFYAYLIPIKNDEKFWELAAKTTPGCGHKGGAWEKEQHIRYDPDNENWVELYNGGYKLLDKEIIRYARNAPAQDSNQHNNWSCGPNSGYRALRILNEVGYNYDSFVENCPRTINSNVLGWIVGLAFLDPGLGFLASTKTDVGPKPDVLANYLTSKMNAHRAKFSGYSEPVDYEDRVSKDILRGLPTIVLLVSGTLSMHYVNIIGFVPCDCVCEGKLCDGITDVVILDTDKEIGVMKAFLLTKWMDRSGYADLLLDSRYNTVEFLKKGAHY
jgi:hypothetical protein